MYYCVSFVVVSRTGEACVRLPHLKFDCLFFYFIVNKNSRAKHRVWSTSFMKTSRFLLFFPLCRPWLMSPSVLKKMTSWPVAFEVYVKNNRSVDRLIDDMPGM